MLPITCLFAHKMPQPIAKAPPPAPAIRCLARNRLPYSWTEFLEYYREVAAVEWANAPEAVDSSASQPAHLATGNASYSRSQPQATSLRPHSAPLVGFISAGAEPLLWNSPDQREAEPEEDSDRSDLEPPAEFEEARRSPPPQAARPPNPYSMRRQPPNLPQQPPDHKAVPVGARPPSRVDMLLGGKGRGRLLPRSHYQGALGRGGERFRMPTPPPTVPKPAPADPNPVQICGATPSSSLSPAQQWLWSSCFGGPPLSEQTGDGFFPPTQEAARLFLGHCAHDAPSPSWPVPNTQELLGSTPPPDSSSSVSPIPLAKLHRDPTRIPMTPPLAPMTPPVASLAVRPDDKVALLDLYIEELKDDIALKELHLRSHQFHMLRNRCRKLLRQVSDLMDDLDFDFTSQQWTRIISFWEQLKEMNQELNISSLGRSSSRSKSPRGRNNNRSRSPVGVEWRRRFWGWRWRARAASQVRRGWRRWGRRNPVYKMAVL